MLCNLEDSESCGPNQYCKVSDRNLNAGCTGFDDIFLSVLTVFTCITLEGWTDVMYMLRDVTSRNYIFDFYFILLVLIGSFFLINLVVAVLFNSFEESEKADTQEIKVEPESEI